MGVEENVGGRLQQQSRDEDSVEKVWGSENGPLLEQASKLYGYALLGAGATSVFTVAISNMPFTKWTVVPLNGTNGSVSTPALDDWKWSLFWSGLGSLVLAIRFALLAASYDKIDKNLIWAHFSWNWAPIVFVLFVAYSLVLWGGTFLLPIALVSSASQETVET